MAIGRLQQLRDWYARTNPGVTSDSYAVVNYVSNRWGRDIAKEGEMGTYRLKSGQSYPVTTMYDVANANQQREKAKSARQKQAYNDLFHYPAGEPRKVRNETTGQVSFGSGAYERSRSTIGARATNRARQYSSGSRPNTKSYSRAINPYGSSSQGTMGRNGLPQWLNRMNRRRRQ